jgi:hypothetical protein
MIYMTRESEVYQNIFILTRCYLNINRMPMMKNLADSMMNPMSSEASKLSVSWIKH